MRKISLTEKLILYFLVIGVFTIVTISWYAYQSGRKAIINRTFDQLTSVRVVKQNLVEKYFSDQIHELKLYANSSGLQKIFQTFNKNPNDINSDNLLTIINSDAYLKESFLENDAVLSICLTIGNQSFKISKKKGQIIPDEVYPGTFQRYLIKNKIDTNYFIREIKNKNQNNYTLLIGQSKSSASNKIMLGIEITLSPINLIMIENDPNTGWGNSGESYIVGVDHLMKTPSRFIQDAVQKIQVHSQAITSALSGHSGTDILKDYRNVDVLSSYSKLNLIGIDWIILAEIDLGEAMAPVNALRNEILFLSIFITSVVFFLAFLLARSISRPVRKLTQAAERIREGDYNVEIEVNQDDEIGNLMEAFNAMARQIRQQSRARIDGQDTERQRLSRELHDGLGQWLVAARFRLESTDCARPEVTRQNINKTKKMVDNIIEEIRRISNDLMPGVLKEFGLESALHAIAREISNTGKLQVQVAISTTLDQLNTDHQIYLFRIIQEALNNIVKHADASLALVKIESSKQSIILTISDNGKGFESNRDKIQGGNGLVNMKERTHLLKGEMQINSRLDFGTELIFTIPLMD